MATIRLENLSKQYQSTDTVIALDGLTQRVEDGEFHVIIGPSGSGKTTLLRLLGGLEDPSEGRIDIEGDPDIGYLSQDYGLFYWLTVRQNMQRMADLTGTDVTEEEIQDLLDLVGIGDRADSLPGELSGGMRQRAALARMLVYDPDILLMDEPFGALDELTRERLYSEFERILADGDQTILYVTHNLEEAYRFGDRVTVLRAGQRQQVLDPESMDEERFNQEAHQAMEV